MHRDRDEVVGKGAGDRPLALVGQQDGLAVGSEQRPEPGSRRNFGKAGEFALEIVALHLAHVGDWPSPRCASSFSLIEVLNSKLAISASMEAERRTRPSCFRANR